MSITPRRGRPPLAEISHLRAQAVQVVLREGYAEVSMRRIADEVGLSLRTLHRYFPSKAEIVWGDIDSSFDALRAALQSANEQLSVIDAVAAVIVEVLGPLDEGPGLERDRIRLIATTPELQVIHSQSFIRWRDELVAFVARRTGEEPTSVTAVSSGAALQAVIMHSLAWWAVQSDAAKPGQAISQAMEGLALIAQR